MNEAKIFEGFAVSATALDALEGQHSHFGRLTYRDCAKGQIARLKEQIAALEAMLSAVPDQPPEAA